MNEGEKSLKKKVMLFVDTGIDDAVALIYALLHPQIDVVGIVSGYGNVEQEKVLRNVYYILNLAKREEIPIISGATGPLSGDILTYYPEIHGPEGLGPIMPPVKEGSIRELSNFDTIFTIIDRYKNDLYIMNLGRLTSLALAYLISPETMGMVKKINIMGGAFLVPGNVTSVAEANFYGDALAASLVMDKAERVSLFPLNITNTALLTPDMVNYIDAYGAKKISKLVKPMIDYYYKSYQKLVPGIQGSPLHDVVPLSAMIQPDICRYVKKRVKVETIGNQTKGMSVADFRPPLENDAKVESNLQSIAMSLNYQSFIDDVIQTLIGGKR
jgi:purine nucleosidase